MVQVVISPAGAQTQCAIPVCKDEIVGEMLPPAIPAVGLPSLHT